MVEINNKTRSKVDLKLIKNVTERFLKFYKKKNYDVSIAFVSDRTMRRLNKRYRAIDMVTDVLSFPATIVPNEDWRGGTGNGDDSFLGEIIIDYNQVKKQAKQYGNSAEKELIFILVHGLLHLFGYDDKSEGGRREMEELGREFVKKINL